MYCNQCGAKNSDTGKFCIACGNALQQSAAAASAAPAAPVEDGSAVPQDAHEQSAAPAQPATPKKKKGGKGVLIVLIVLLLLVGGGVAAWQLGLLDDYLPSDETTTWQGNYDLGVQFVKDERYQDAIAAFREAIAIDPAQPDVYLSLAELYVIIDEPETAIEVLEEGYEATEDEEIAEVLAEYIIQYPGTPDEETAGEEEETIAPTPEPTAEPTPEPALELVWELEPSLAFDALKSMCTTEYAVSPFSEFYTYQKDGLWGIVDSSFEVVLEPTSSEPYRFCEMGHVMYVYDEETLALLDEYGLGTACAHGGGRLQSFISAPKQASRPLLAPLMMARWMRGSSA